MHDLMNIDPAQPGALTRVEIESVAARGRARRQ
jgi:hypothetical protein